jgi:hypothetical protein
MLWVLTLALWLALAAPAVLAGTARHADASPRAETEQCLACHGEKSLTTSRKGKTVFLFVDAKTFSSFVHGSLGCTACHADLEGKELPHDVPLAKVQCGVCHSSELEQYGRSLHGQAVVRKDPLAPTCATCHGKHDILPVKDPHSAVEPLKVPFVCGGCHREGSPVQLYRNIP